MGNPNISKEQRDIDVLRWIQDAEGAYKHPRSGSYTPRLIGHVGHEPEGFIQSRVDDLVKRGLLGCVETPPHGLYYTVSEAGSVFLADHPARTYTEVVSRWEPTNLDCEFGMMYLLQRIEADDLMRLRLIATSRAEGLQDAVTALEASDFCSARHAVLRQIKHLQNLVERVRDLELAEARHAADKWRTRAENTKDKLDKVLSGEASKLAGGAE